MQYPKILISTLLALLFLLPTNARQTPPALRTLYNTIRASGPCTGPDLLKTGFFDQTEGSPPLWSYCQRHTSHTAIYLKGPGSALANMDIDCDGVANATGPDPHDKRCTGFADTQFQTAFKPLLQKDGYTIPGGDLNTYIHPYIVLGNWGRWPYRTFDPRSAGVHALSLAAVVCGDQLIYGIWGDVNGDDGPPLVGEASLALATACFGQAVNGSSGWDGTDVLYLAFKGAGAVPGPSGARWDARSYAEFEESVEGLGYRLVGELVEGVYLFPVDWIGRVVEWDPFHMRS
ncbi:fungal chitosanase of glycosyl hydrolase group 75-domain-containing protein [Aspergillus pseudoustus]|uniref:Endo-chitosanase n=1 Tax=Aspergillus pseudoustus TaxID=1810923 RepID=A0ABR4IKU6_9EURO